MLSKVLQNTFENHQRVLEETKGTAHCLIIVYMAQSYS